MTEKFIKNEQLNFIKKQITFIKDSKNKNVPKNVLATVIDLANAKIMDLFPHLSDEQSEMLDVSKLKTESDYEQYIQHLSEYLLPFPIMTEQQLKKMFPKQKN